MMVVVEILTGPLFYIQVGDDATVAHLKKEIGAQQELPSERLILVHDSDDKDQNLPIISDDQDGVTLVDCGIKDGSKIYLLFHPIDNGSSQQSVSTLPESFLE